MKKLLFIFPLLLITVSQKNKNYTKLDPLEKLKNILLNGRHEFNVYELSRENKPSKNKRSNTYVNAETSEIFLLNKNSNDIKSVFEENQKNNLILKQLDYTINYNIIKSKSTIKLNSEDNRIPNLSFDLNTNNIKLQNVYKYLDFKKEIFVADSDNILNSEWSGFYWDSDIKIQERVYSNSVTLGVLKNHKKIYIKITTYENKNKKTFVFISV